MARDISNTTGFLDHLRRAVCDLSNAWTKDLENFATRSKTDDYFIFLLILVHQSSIMFHYAMLLHDDNVDELLSLHVKNEKFEEMCRVYEANITKFKSMIVAREIRYTTHVAEVEKKGRLKGKEAREELMWKLSVAEKENEDIEMRMLAVRELRMKSEEQLRAIKVVEEDLARYTCGLFTESQATSWHINEKEFFAVWKSFKKWPLFLVDKDFTLKISIRPQKDPKQVDINIAGVKSCWWFKHTWECLLKRMKFKNPELFITDRTPSMFADGTHLEHSPRYASSHQVSEKSHNFQIGY
ncbi:hypothetical protein ACS0TY_030548 [Phlomoides rotata]